MFNIPVVLYDEKNFMMQDKNNIEYITSYHKLSSISSVNALKVKHIYIMDTSDYLYSVFSDKIINKLFMCKNIVSFYAFSLNSIMFDNIGRFKNLIFMDKMLHINLYSTHYLPYTYNCFYKYEDAIILLRRPIKIEDCYTCQIWYTYCSSHISSCELCNKTDNCLTPVKLRRMVYKFVNVHGINKHNYYINSLNINVKELIYAVESKDEDVKKTLNYNFGLNKITIVFDTKIMQCYKKKLKIPFGTKINGCHNSIINKDRL